ncbi:MAG: DUF5666 domain-containing protein [Burkholderiaceae bacterium]|jgi:hypothetical protein|nr:DUF5666 domain-containing protein [Burkholderiaceae bacterium]
MNLIARGAGRGRSALVCLLGSLAVAISGCGGGGGDNATPAPVVKQSSFVEGPITGFGSIIVGGVRFDDSAARIDDDDDRPRRTDDLQLGMMVEIEAGAIDRAAGRADATRIRFGAEIVGPVESVDTGASKLIVFGQTVQVRETTVFDDSLAGGLTAIAVGDVLEVHAQFNAASGVYVATRIDSENDADLFRLRGLVTDLDTSAKTFRIGTALISYASAESALRRPLAEGERLRVRTQTTQVDGAWVAVQLREGDRRPDNHDEAEVHGLVTQFDSRDSFVVDGMRIDASGVADVPAGVAVGAEVEVEGAIVDGVLVARKVELEDSENDRERFEIHGAIDKLDVDGNTLVVRGITVAFDRLDALECRGAALANGHPVEVRGALSTDGTRLAATRIHCED